MWQAPSRPPLAIDECPASLVTPESLALVRDFLVARQFGQPPLGGGFYTWPARLVDAWLVLARECERFAEREAQRSEAERRRPG